MIPKGAYTFRKNSANQKKFSVLKPKDKQGKLLESSIDKELSLTWNGDEIVPMANSRA